MFGTKETLIGNEIGLLRRTVELSTLAYADPWPGHPELDHHGRLVNTRYSTFLDLYWDAEAIYIAVRGTEPTSVGDWRSNLDTGSTPSGILNGGVHRGFYQAAKAIFEGLRPELLTLTEAGPRPVFITGHSRGGAIAQLLQPMVEGVGLWSGLWTFGAPPIMDRDAAETYGRVYGQRATRVWIGNDPVPRIRVHGYQHPRMRELYVDSLGRAQTGPVSLGTILLQWVWRLAHKNSPSRFTGLSEHRYQHYKKVIDRL
jgi:hypothetical protein